MISDVYKQLIEDYIELNNVNSGFTFGRIMNFIFKRLSNDEKDLYLWIRYKISLERLDRLLSWDWINNNYEISDRLIELARHWKKTDIEKVEFT